MRDHDQNEEPEALLRDASGNPVPLQGVAVRGRLSGTLASVEVEQRYRNPLDHNIEAVYTFPLPMGAVLLEVVVEVDGRTLAGQVVERKTAERRYEDAITDGDTAVMVQDNSDGLYTMNFGNLMAGEEAVIRYRYAMTLAWHGDRLRFLVPTTIAPRYGDPLVAGLRPWEAPESDLMVEYPFELNIVVEGSLADCELGSPTHPVSVGRCASGMEVKLSRTACLDRDFVLTAVSRDVAPASVTVANDGEGNVAFASLRVPLVAADEAAPLCLKVVIDCSGSMSGSSIAQARKGALAILDQLRPQDYVNFTLFGSRHEHLFKHLRPCEDLAVEHARGWLAKLTADMGGTETGAALKSVYKLSGKASRPFEQWVAETCPGSRPAVLLITDGEIWQHEAVVQGALSSGHRVFTVGVGTAVAEGFVSEIARATGGACELVSPQEGMAEKILAQFHRLRQSDIKPIELAWDVAPLWQTPLPETLFAGDTVNLFAGFGPQAPARLTYTGGASGAVATVTAELPDIPRLAAQARIDVLEDDEEKLALALRYQLLTPQTSFLVVAERVAKAEDLPELMKVPQMLPVGMFEAQVPHAICYSISSYDRDYCSDIGHLDIEGTTPPTGLPPAVFRRARPSFDDFCDTPDTPSESPAQALPGSAAPELLRLPVDSSPEEFAFNLDRALVGFRQVDALPATIDELEQFGLPAGIAEALRGWVGSSLGEAEIVLAFLHALAESEVGAGLERGLLRLIMSARKRAAVSQAVDDWLAASLSAVEAGRWNWLAVRVPEEAVRS